MKNLRWFVVTAGFISMFGGLSPFTSAQENSGMLVDVSRCVGMANPEQRYRCFDEITAHLRGNAQKQPVASAAVSTNQVNESARKAPPDPTVREFGLDSSNARITKNAEGDAELRDIIAQLEEKEPGRWLVTLKSGQVWYQDTTQRIRLKEGMNVRIYPSSFGNSYRLAADEINGVIQVRRVK